MSEYTDLIKQIPLDPRPDLPIFSNILELYYSKRGSKILPSWSDFIITDFIGWHANMALSEKEGGDFRFRIFGTGFADLFGSDFTGKRLCESMAAGHTEACKAHFVNLVQEKHIGWVKGNLPIEGRDFLPFEVIDLPLQDDNGEVTKFLHFISV
ncbi:PAS domain-containing protein [Kordiimonas sp. SCSIO 12603]|uniref:PAS domain-containing protein n=1 Tax=Kordiimonas sp. SCSIO 12603 TaxID=2829596 RepID=UPI002105DE55|nr:PAS domain-containing protein [Kordiimonas sp. SCSIO 12603]UTW56995.1 PAS domain-containing protein [Kordiimonas sp. SCSIO 12603]